MKKIVLLFLLVALLTSMLTLAACEFNLDTGSDEPAADSEEEQKQEPEPEAPLYTEGDGGLGGDGNVKSGDGETNPGTTTPADPFDD